MFVFVIGAHKVRNFVQEWKGTAACGADKLFFSLFKDLRALRTYEEIFNSLLVYSFQTHNVHNVLLSYQSQENYNRVILTLSDDVFYLTRIVI